MDLGESGFLTKEEADRLIQEAAANENRPYMVTRRGKSRFCVSRVGEKRQFQLGFWRMLNGKSHITRNVAHICATFQSTVTPTLIEDVVKASIINNSWLTTSERRDIVSAHTNRSPIEDVYYARTQVDCATDAGHHPLGSLPGFGEDIRIESGDGDRHPPRRKDLQRTLLVSVRVEASRVFQHTVCRLVPRQSTVWGVLLFASSIDGNG